MQEKQKKRELNRTLAYRAPEPCVLEPEPPVLKTRTFPETNAEVHS